MSSSFVAYGAATWDDFAGLEAVELFGHEDWDFLDRAVLPPALELFSFMLAKYCWYCEVERGMLLPADVGERDAAAERPRLCRAPVPRQLPVLSATTRKNSLYVMRLSRLRSNSCTMPFFSELRKTIPGH